MYHGLLICALLGTVASALAMEKVAYLAGRGHAAIRLSCRAGQQRSYVVEAPAKTMMPTELRAPSPRKGTRKLLSSCALVYGSFDVSTDLLHGVTAHLRRDGSREDSRFLVEGAALSIVERPPRALVAEPTTAPFAYLPLSDRGRMTGGAEAVWKRIWHQCAQHETTGHVVEPADAIQCSPAA